MEALQKAYDSRSSKVNKIEKMKDQRSPQEAYTQLEQYAKDGYASIPAEDKNYFLKCFGIYDRPATPERFMIKMRIPGGHLNATQARVIGECAKEYGQDYIDLTTRAQCELRYLKIEDLPSLVKRMEAVGLTAYQTGVDNIRGIMGDPLDDLAYDNILPSQKILLKLQETFLQSPEWISTLPRKFNTAITGSTTNRCNIFTHDASFALAQKDGVYGYNMYLGGKVGVIAKNANIFLKNEEEIVKAFDSIINLFKKFGFRDNRNKNRLHFLIEAVGIEVMSQAIRENAGVDFATAGMTMTNADCRDSEQGKVQLRDGSFAVHVVIPSGVFTGSGMIGVADLSDKYGNGEVRFDMEQSLYILGIHDTKSLLEEDFFLTYKNIHSPYFNNLIACAGTEHCPFGVIENKNDAINMSKYLDEKVPLESGKVRMYWSACVKGCGIHSLGDIGFEGCKAKLHGETVGGVNIYLGGKLVSEGVEGHTILKAAPLEFASQYVETLMHVYKKHKKEDEKFEFFSDRIFKNYTNAYLGFSMKLGAYLRAKNIDFELSFSENVHTGKNEEFEVFELGRKLYYALSKKEAYTAYERFSNVLNEKLEDIRILVPEIDENIAKLCDSILCSKEEKRAVVFSELTPLVELY